MLFFSFAILFSLFSVGEVVAKANFTVAPGVLEFDLKNLGTQNFLITNTGDERVRLIIRPIYFEIDSKFLKAGQHLDPQKPPQDDLTDFILVSPKVVSLSPGQKRNVRVAVRSIKKFENGDYRTHLLVKSLQGSSPAKDEQVPEVAEGLSISLEMTMEAAVALYGRVGLPKTKLEWNCRTTKDGDMLLVVDNDSPWKYSGWFSVFDVTTADKPELFIQSRLVSLRDSKRFYLVQKPYPEKISLRWGKDKNNLDNGPLNCETNPQ